MSGESECTPDSYARFLQMLKHSSAKPLVAKAQQFVQNFDGNVPRDQAAEKIHRFLTRAEEWMLSEAVVFAAEADEEGRANATEGLEKFLLSRLYPKVFATDSADRAADARLRRQLVGLSWVELSHLGVPPVDASLLPRGVSELRNIDQYKAPRDKLVCILNACRVITDILRRTRRGQSGLQGKRPLSADDFLPLLIFLLIRANPPRLHSNAEYIATFRHPSRLVGEDAYFVTTLLSAKEFLVSARPDAFEVSLDEFNERFADAVGKDDSLAEAEAELGAGPPPQLVPAPQAATPENGNSRGAAAVEDAERTLFSRSSVALWQIPPSALSSGHRAAQWATRVFEGACTVACKSKSRVLSIRVAEASSGKLMAHCHVPADESYTKYVQPTLDSSRHFVLKVTNGERHAFVGPFGQSLTSGFLPGGLELLSDDDSAEFCKCLAAHELETEGKRAESSVDEDVVGSNLSKSSSLAGLWGGLTASLPSLGLPAAASVAASAAVAATGAATAAAAAAAPTALRPAAPADEVSLQTATPAAN
eukprot:CAMPEP_0172699982 /NCGR_PEP_ID=MMETSP1074-20121228/30582_1 /TAXON_ID=2916 /ORGANISM="Ceratium fusus, Strain PA161109" /LENGTH=535 /DNA_ID=CAMNT_0013521281 /DNA_START=62 /DNA_END=1666 /DNA_ORIENTATION=+